MFIGIFSDLHDNIDNLKQIFKQFEERKVTEAIFCGDFCSPIPAKEMGQFNNIKIHCVFGNGDGDRLAIFKFSDSVSKNLIIHGEHAEIEIDNVKIAVTHYPLYGRALAMTGDYDAVFSGHDHTSKIEKINECLWLNPGEALGWKGSATFGFYNTENNSGEIIEL